MQKVFGKYLGAAIVLLSVIVLVSIGTAGSAEAYDAHGPIFILDNASLISLGFPGEGTEENPFLIQNYEIDGAGGSAIAIYDTDLHVKIRNCLLSDSTEPSSVIHLENVQNVTIENNRLVDSYVGVGLVSSNNIVIQDNIFEGYNTGMVLDNSDDNVLFNNTCVLDIAEPTGRVGIQLISSDHNRLEENNCSGNNVGIELRSSNYNTLVANICDDNDGDGIAIDSSINNTVTENVCRGNSIGGMVLYSSLSVTTGNEISSNTCSGSALVTEWGAGIFLSSSTTYPISGNNISDNELINNYHGIWALNSGSNNITFNTVHGNQVSGIYLNSTSNCIVSSNTVYDNGDSGIWLDGSSGCMVNFNTAWSNFNGTCLYDSDDNILSHNELQGNTYGIYLSISSYNTVSDNNCSDSVGGDGIQLRSSDFNTLQNNIANDNVGWRGIFLFTSSSNTLRNNTCNGNSDGISIYSRNDAFSTDNVIHNNTCVLNTNAGINVQAYSDGTIITNNTCNDNANRGVQISASSNCRIANNTGLRNVDGLFISTMNIENVIDDNDFSDNTRYGIYIGDSIGSSVANNTCVGNAQMGIRVNNFHSGSIVNNTGNEAGVGIYLTSSDDNQVINNNCSLNTADPGSNYGIWLTSSHRNTITDNICDQNGNSGIYLGYSNDNVLTNNSCSGNPGAGVFLYYAHASVLYSNTLNGNGIGIETDHSYDLVIVENEIHENTNGMELYGADGSDVIGNNCTAASLMYYQTYGIFLKYSLSVIVLDNDCNYNYVGIMNEDSDDIVISDNNCDLNFQTGIELRWALGNVVSNNSCTGNSIGMTVIASEGNTISDNNCSGNVQAGINFYNGDSPHNVICNNTFSNNGYGMWVESLIDSRIWNNTCEDNAKAGMRIAYRCNYNVIENNTIINNGYLLKDDGYGMWSAGMGMAIDGSGEYNWCDGNIIANNTIENSRLYGLQILNSFGNRVFGNVFIGNNGTTSEYDPAKVQAFDDGTNFWNDTTYGNLWADWTSPDADGDGIVDEAYLIDGGANNDLLPLAVSVAITSPADGFVTGETSVDISGTAVSYFGVDHLTWHNAATGASGDCSGTDIWTATVPLADGDNVITVTMVDLHGSEANASITVVLDVVPPTLEITYPVEGAYVGSSVTVTWIGSDADSGIAYYIVSIEGLFFVNVTESSYTINDLAEGPCTVLVTAYDVAGNYLDVPVSFTVDVTAPTVTIDSPADNFLSTESSVTMTWNGSDVVSGVDRYEVSWEGGAPVTLLPSDSTYTFNGLSDGSHVLTVTVYDKAGLSSSDAVTIRVDTQPPSLTITYPVEGGYVANSDVTVTWSGFDAGTGVAYYTASIEGLAPFNTTGTSCTFNDLADGTYTVLVSAYDQLGNHRDVTATFTVDTVAPALAIDSPEEGQLLNSSSVTVSWNTTDDNPGTVLVRFDDEAWATATGEEFSKTALNDGHHTAYVKATDAAGNSVEGMVNFTVDTTAPTVAFISPGEGSLVNSSTGMVEWAVDDAVSSIRVDGGAWIELGPNTSWEYSLEDGAHIIEVKVTDLAGNSAIATLNITVDTVAPEAEVSPIGDDLELDLVILVEFSEEMNQTSVSVVVPGVTGALDWEGNAVMFTPSVLYYNHEYAVQVTGKDLAGNGFEVNWTFSTRSVGNLTGVILDENGDPVSNVTVTAGGEFTTVTDENGRFVFLNLSVGTYLFEVDAEGYEPFSFNATVEQGVTSDQGTVEMVLDDTEGEEDDGGSIWQYVIIAIIVVAVLGVVAFVFLRKK